MIQITYVEHNGIEHRVDLAIGTTLMDGAKDNMIPGIDADCGGACACATCHVFFDAADKVRVGEPGSQESDMLEVLEERHDSSRLSCQVRVAEALAGLVVKLPASQR
ncbi:MAG: 2Fe-2S ferredoxin [Hydrocarboniphaga sp.]|uniref:2Fe-2S iron-sulfur cluster-binding protein n=1 Tax=Hydrocarboniphaga sp. TaxID=2033016 RepID=UPI002610A00C|nr:2Fe-2S iron-sulfur cluster-binding protein [Hydrocarboniphaga sp.]MDB5970181.1 2Fe-2S ferredoxin [Hydrocarboniphaga sp.]